MSLDINTEKGQVTLADEQEMLARLHEAYPKAMFVQTPKDSPADVDGFVIMKPEKIFAVFETKCRYMTQEDLDRFGGEWLVTFEKIQKGATIAKALCVPFVGYLYLVPDKKILMIKITDEDGNILPKVRIARTETQATCNGGSITRTNAYIDMTGAKTV